MKELINKLCWSKSAIKEDMSKDNYYVSVSDVIMLLEECAKQQRQLCADNAETKTAGTNYNEYDIVDLDTILNAPQPEIQ